MNATQATTSNSASPGSQPPYQLKPLRFDFPQEPKFPYDPAPRGRVPRIPPELRHFLPDCLCPLPLGALPPHGQVMAAARKIQSRAKELREQREMFRFPKPDDFFGWESATGFVSFPARVQESLGEIPYSEWGPGLRRDVFLGLLLNLTELRAVYIEVERRSRGARVARSLAVARHYRRADALAGAKLGTSLRGPVPDTGLVGRMNRRLECFLQYRYELVPLMERVLSEISSLFYWMLENARDEMDEIGLGFGLIISGGGSTTPATSPVTSPATSLVKPVTPHTPPPAAPAAPAPLSRSTCGKPGVPNWPNPRPAAESLSTSSYDVDDERNTVV